LLEVFLMIRMKSTIFVLSIFLFLLCATSNAQNSCVTAQCHATLLKAKNVHPATESCDSCHESISQPHPQKGVKTFKTIQDLTEVCAVCHESVSTKKVVHPPVKEGSCTMCHDPHASNEPKLLTQPLQEICLTCHGDHTDFKVVHGPAAAGDCVNCHNPHQSDNDALLVQAQPELCLNCHGDMQATLKMKVIHPAIEAGCTACHNPHGSGFPHLLASTGAGICNDCHGDIVENIQKAKTVHPPVQEGACAKCHSPHASDHAKLLPLETKDLCMTCHNNILTKEKPVIHPAITDGDCTACHSPHSSNQPKLLVAEYPSQRYAPYNDQEYELCFTCHDREMVQYPDTSFATNFRDGEKNLHYVHVHMQKGRTCGFCHDMHASKNPKLIIDSVPFGKWNLPLKFVKTENGGSCSPGCHQPQKYERKKTKS
jgi:predicted CXXCH cytochrome family protein